MYLNVNSDDVELYGCFHHAHDGKQERDARDCGQEDHVPIPICQYQSIIVVHPRFWNLSVEDEPYLRKIHILKGTFYAL